MKPEFFQCGVTALLNLIPNDTQDDSFFNALEPHQSLMSQIEGAEKENVQNMFPGFQMECRGVEELVTATHLPSKTGITYTQI